MMQRACQELYIICFMATEGSASTVAAAIGAAALLAIVPLASPLVQIWLLARKSKEDIEATVRVKEPLQACTVLNSSGLGELLQANAWLAPLLQTIASCLRYCLADHFPITSTGL